MLEDLRKFHCFQLNEIANKAIPSIDMVSGCQSPVQAFVIPSVRPSDHMYQRHSHWTDLREI